MGLGSKLYINFSGWILSLTFIYGVVMLITTYSIAASNGHIPDCDGFSISQSINYGAENTAGIVFFSVFAVFIILADFGIMMWRQERHHQKLCTCSEQCGFNCRYSKSYCSWLTFALIIAGCISVVLVAVFPKDIHDANDGINYQPCRVPPGEGVSIGPKGSLIHYYVSMIAFGSLTVAMILEVIVDTLEFYSKTGVRCKLLFNAGFFMVLQSVFTLLATFGYILMVGGVISTHYHIKYRGTLTAHDIFFDVGELTVFAFLTLSASMLGIRILCRARKEEAWPEGAEGSESLKKKGNEEDKEIEVENVGTEPTQFMKDDPYA